MSNQVYIVQSATFFPNQPISNDEMEDYLGLINHKESRSKRIILRNNGIKRRFYAMDRNGIATHTNAQMTALAVRKLFDEKDSKGLESIDLLSCGTSTPDQMMPSHGVMVHGWLPETRAIEVVSPSGVCCAGMHAFKYAYMSVKLGDSEKAVATGSERISRILRSDVFEEESKKLELLEGNGYVGFEKEFLRFMLSDGAGALLLSNKPGSGPINLSVEWLEGVSYAHQVKPCMYMGSEKMEDGNIKSYMDYSPQEIMEESILSIKQDVKLLSEYIVKFGFDKLKEIFDKRGLTVDQVDYFLPHMSSEFFRSKIADQLSANGMTIPQEKWFTNLSSVGNVGAGSIYMMLDELMKSGQLKKGQKLLLTVPESSRFSYMFAFLTVC